jgi:hypothetical protein
MFSSPLQFMTTSTKTDAPVSSPSAFRLQFFAHGKESVYIEQVH